MMTRTTMMTIRGSRMSTSIMQSYNYNLLVYDETCLQHCKLTYDPLFSEDERLWLYFDISLDMISPGFFWLFSVICKLSLGISLWFMNDLQNVIYQVFCKNFNLVSMIAFFINKIFDAFGFFMPLKWKIN